MTELQEQDTVMVKEEVDLVTEVEVVMIRKGGDEYSTGSELY